MLKAPTRRRTPRLDLAWCPGAANHPRLGLIVPRYGRSAVRRNRLRRQLREVMRRGLLRRLPAVDLVIRARPPAYEAARAVLAADLARSLSGVEP